MLDIYGLETLKSAPIKYDDIQRMHYLDCIIKETLRLFPVIPLIGRKVMENLKIGDHILPKGTDVIIPIIYLHRNEKYWPNPLTFDPDRFLPDKIKDRPSHCYIPFGDGPRNCIGMNYGMIAIKVILATLVRAFVFKVDKSIDIKDIELNAYIMLSTIKPLKVKIEKRNLQQMRENMLNAI
ncbi:cytochrome P450 4V2-like [Pogonomyrmex barbatus]|uniref:Cytochrome P450 4V2-like n=1 Tax=Pogonomyrmex barbatus TaxID=144034 RepID=A0A6I9XEF4_9HYME|nr:cytochrome P450 4V2-like [Pogonomyrmex barbatus]XP_025075124.1 cytochrome P450 4V2-like [Pogonomyrmex barbatus]